MVQKGTVSPELRTIEAHRHIKDAFARRGQGVLDLSVRSLLRFSMFFPQKVGMNRKRIRLWHSTPSGQGYPFIINNNINNINRMYLCNSSGRSVYLHTLRYNCRLYSCVKVIRQMQQATYVMGNSSVALHLQNYPGILLQFNSAVLQVLSNLWMLCL